MNLRGDHIEMCDLLYLLDDDNNETVSFEEFFEARNRLKEECTRNRTLIKKMNDNKNVMLDRLEKIEQQIEMIATIVSKQI